MRRTVKGINRTVLTRMLLFPTGGYTRESTQAQYWLPQLLPDSASYSCRLLVVSRLIPFGSWFIFIHNTLDFLSLSSYASSNSTYFITYFLGVAFVLTIPSASFNGRGGGTHSHQRNQGLPKNSYLPIDRPRLKQSS